MTDPVNKTTDEQSSDRYDEGFKDGVMAALRSLSRQYSEITSSIWRSDEFVQEVKKNGDE